MRTSYVLESANLEDFLKKDTKNYTNTRTSVACRIYNFETKTLPADKIRIQRLMEDKEAAETEYQNAVKDAESRVSKNLFSKLSLIAKKRQQIQEAANIRDGKLKIIEHQIKFAKQTYEEDRIKCQELKDKLGINGIDWNELKRLVAEKIAQGFLVFEGQKKDISKKTGNLDVFKNPNFIAKKRTRTKPADGGRTFKEKNISTKQDLLKLKGLTLSQKRELEEILGHFFYDDDGSVDYETAMKIRLALMADQKKRYNAIAMNTSNKVLARDVIGYFMKDSGRAYLKDFQSIFSSDKLKRDFFNKKAFEMLSSSGFSMEKMRDLLPKYSEELKYLFSNPKEVSLILSNLQNQQENEQALNIEFEKLLKTEVLNRVRQNEQLYSYKPQTGQIHGPHKSSSGPSQPASGGDRSPMSMM